VDERVIERSNGWAAMMRGRTDREREVSQQLGVRHAELEKAYAAISSIFIFCTKLVRFPLKWSIVRSIGGSE
jgi:hypothetical protein